MLSIDERFHHIHHRVGYVCRFLLPISALISSFQMCLCHISFPACSQRRLIRKFLIWCFALPTLSLSVFVPLACRTVKAEFLLCQSNLQRQTFKRYKKELMLGMWEMKRSLNSFGEDVWKIFIYWIHKTMANLSNAKDTWNVITMNASLALQTCPRGTGNQTFFPTTYSRPRKKKYVSCLKLKRNR